MFGRASLSHAVSVRMISIKDLLATAGKAASTELSLTVARLLCAIASLAEEPDAIFRLFELERHVQEANAEGVYQLRMCKNGCWQTVRVDDFIPCRPGGGPVFATAKHPELWVILIEKVRPSDVGSVTQ